MIKLEGVEEREVKVAIREAQIAAKEAQLAAHQTALESMKKDMNRATADAVERVKKIEDILILNLGGSAEAYRSESDAQNSMAHSLWRLFDPGNLYCSPCSKHCCNNR